jgi:hypothetical protein
MGTSVEVIKEKLISKKSADRLYAAKSISKERILALAEDLFVAYTEERLDPRTWEPQCEMIRALGILDYKPALAIVSEIVNKNAPHDMITSSAATTFVQLKRKSIFDARPVLELLDFGSTSVISGSLRALAVDKMVPPVAEAKKIIALCWDINKHKDRVGQEWGLIDPRQYLAIACAGWDQDLCSGFLNHCIETANNIDRFNKPSENTQLIEFCKKSLKGKYASF